MISVYELAGSGKAQAWQAVDKTYKKGAILSCLWHVLLDAQLRLM